MCDSVICVKKRKKKRIKKSLADYPNLIAEWNWEKNGDLKPEDISHGSNKKIWWKCFKNHEWQTTPHDRNSKNAGCPYCAGKKANIDNCLATLYPQIASEWNKNKNGNLTPFDITSGSKKKVWWECHSGHEWQNEIWYRTRGFGKCSICSSFGVVYPTLAKEWHKTKNGDLTPFDISPRSNKKIWWQCPISIFHQYQSTADNRVDNFIRSPGSESNGCPYCSSTLADNSNCLSSVFPEIANEWNVDRNNLTASDYTAYSGKKVWWKCCKNHEWQADICSRTGRQKSGCPFCCNRKACHDNCLAVLYPNLSLEWHPVKNANLTPYDIVAGSGTKIWWQCLKSPQHEWLVSSGSRIFYETGCPYCNESKGENKIAAILNKSGLLYCRQFSFNNCRNIKVLRFDFRVIINNKYFLIEFQGKQHYTSLSFGSIKSDKINFEFEQIKKRDKIKEEYCEEHKIPLLKIPYWEYDNIEKVVLIFIKNMETL